MEKYRISASLPLRGAITSAVATHKSILYINNRKSNGCNYISYISVEKLAIQLAYLVKVVHTALANPLPMLQTKCGEEDGPSDALGNEHHQRQM